MKLPFTHHQSSEITTAPLPSRQPITEHHLARALRLPVSCRRVCVVTADQATAFRVKARLLSSGHRDVTAFFSPDDFLRAYQSVTLPDIVLIDDFADGDTSLTGTAVVQQLRLERQFTGLLLALSADHDRLAEPALKLHGWSGTLNRYLAGLPAVR